MVTLINKNKEIDARRVLDVEHQFEAMVGARKRRYNDTPAQKQRTEFVEDYYLLYTRNKKKLAEFEDFMEEQGFESLEDLENVIGYIYFVDGCDEQGNEIHEQRWITYKEVFKEIMNEKRELKQENKALKSRWQELKDWINTRYSDYKFEGYIVSPETQELDAIKNKMQELEQSKN